MGIFDIFNRDQAEQYKGFTLNKNVDVALQKQLIDRGRGNEIQAMDVNVVKDVNNSFQTEDSTPAMVSNGISKLEAQPVSFIKDVLPAVKKDVTKIVSDTPILGINTAYSPAEDTQPGNLKTLQAEQEANPAPFTSKDYLAKENIAKSGIFTGFTGGIIKPEAKMSGSFTDKAIYDVASTIGTVASLEMIGGAINKLVAGSETLGSLFLKYPKVTKYVYPFLQNAAAFDIYGQLDPEITDRVKQLGKDTLLSVPYSALGFISKARYSVPAAFGLGFGLAKMDGASNEDAFMQGSILSILDASGRLAGKNGEASKDIIKGRFADKVLKYEAMNVINAYSDFQVTAKSTPEEIKSAYYNAAKKTHPDMGGTDADFTKLQNAYDILNPKGKMEQEPKPIEPVKTNIKTDEKMQVPTNPADQDILRQAVESAQNPETGVPNIISDAIAVAKQDVIPASQEQNIQAKPTDIYHQTNNDVNAIKDTGFIPGKNSVYGEAAFFAENPDKTYGDNQIKENTSNYNLKTFSTLSEEQAYIKKFNASNLADAIRADGVYDGFVIPNKTLGNTYGITNQEKLNKNLKSQQFITTEEARKMSDSFPFIEKLDIPVVAKNNILTQNGKMAFGKYSRGMIEFIENPHKTTVPHEAVHAYMDIVMTPEQKQIVINEAKKRFAGKIVSAKKSGLYKNSSTKGLSDDAIAEEILAEDMINYVKKGEASSNKLKRFYQWFIDILKKMFGKKNIDVIDKFYKDIQKTPGLTARNRATDKIARMGDDLHAVQMEYAQDPEALTSKILKNVDVANRVTSTYAYMTQVMSSLDPKKGKGIKQAEWNLVNDILQTEQFKDNPKINMDDFRNAIKAELMPLSAIETDTYANYGAEAVGLDYKTQHKTYLLNSPFKHGKTGHFGSDFDEYLKADQVEIKEIPAQEGNPTAKFAVVRKGVDLTEENIAENVIQLAYSKAEAKKWIEDHNGNIRVGKSGLFAHIRTFDETINEGEATRINRELIEKSDSLKANLSFSQEAQTTYLNTETSLPEIRKFINKEFQKMLQEDSSLDKNYTGRASELGFNWIQNNDFRALSYEHGNTFGKDQILMKNGKFDFNGTLTAMKERIQEITNRSTDYVDSINDLRKQLETEQGKLQSDEERISHIAEIQSDVFQSDRLKSSASQIEELQMEVSNNKANIVEMKNRLSDPVKNDMSEDAVKYTEGQITSLEEKNIHQEGRIAELKKQQLAPSEKQFFAFRNTWHERSIREIIRIKAMEGATILRFPTPYTVSKIEGYVAADGEDTMPYEVVSGNADDGLMVGDVIDYGGERMEVVNADGSTITVAPEGKVNSFRHEDAVEEEVQNKTDELQSEFNDLEKYFGTIDTPEKAQAVIDKIQELNKYIDFKKADVEIASLNKDASENDYAKKQLAYYENLKKNPPKKPKGLVKELTDRNYQFYLDNADKLLEKMADSESENVSIDDFDQEMRDYFYEGANDTSNYEDVYGKDNVFYDNAGYNMQVTIVDEGTHTEEFQQPHQYEHQLPPDPENFDYENYLSENNATVARYYDKQVIPYLRKLRGENLRLITDDKENTWWETNITPEDKGAVEAFQTPNNQSEPLKRSGYDVAKYIKEIDKENGSEPDDYLLQNIKEFNKNFTLQSVKIDDLIKQDKDLAAYVEAGQNRYAQDEIAYSDNIDLPVVIGNWDAESYGVMDGFNRILSKKQNGEEYIQSWVSDKIKIPMPSSQMADLEYRRAIEQANRGNAQSETELNILAARETDLSYNDSEKERGYQNFKKLAKRRPWVMDPQTDDTTLKRKLPSINIDNLLFEGDKETPQSTQLEQFKDRLYQEETMALTAKEKTPSEIDFKNKQVAEKIVKSEKFGRKVTLKNAMNIVRGIELPITITAKESSLLKSRLKDMAKAAKEGANYGRSEMRADLNLAFSTKLNDLKSIRKAIVAYADQLPADLRGGMLNAAATAKTELDMAKAFARIDATLKNADNKAELEKMKSLSKKVSKAMKTGTGIAVDYQKKIADILNEYNLKNPTKATIEKLNKLSEYILAHPEANIPAHLIKRLDILKRKSPKDLTGSSLKDLNDLLGRLWALGELKLAMKGKYDERFIQQSVDQLLLTTVNADKSSIGRIAWLHAPRVADILDGMRNYKGNNVALQKKVSGAVAQAMQRSEQIIKETTDAISAIKNEFSQEEQVVMAFQMAKDQGLFTQAQSLLSAYAEEYGWKKETDLKMTPEMQHTIDTMRGKFNETVDYLAAVYEEIENKPFVKNDNYFPAKYDKTFDKHIDLEAPTINEMAQYATKQINKGFTFQRVPGVKKVLRTDIFNVFADAISEQQYYMSVQPVLNEISNIVGDKRYQEAVGKVGVQYWDRYLKAVANKGKSLNRGIFDSWLKEKRLNISKAILGFKFTSSLLQPSAIIDAYSYTYLNYGALPANAMIMRLAGTLTLPSYSKGIVDKSLALTLRKGGETAIQELNDERTGRITKALTKAGMWGIRELDLKTAAAVQRTMYQHFRGQGLPEAEAQKEADFVMNLTQGSSEIGDLPLVLMEGELYKTLLTFQTFVLNRWGLIAHDIVRSGIIHGGLSRKVRGLIALFLISLAGGVENILRTKITEFISGNKYPQKFNFLVQSLLTAPEAIPVLGQFITSGVELNQGASFPLSRLGDNLIGGAYQFVNPSGKDQQAKDKNRVKGALKFAEAIASYNGVIGAAQLADFITRALIPPTSNKNASGSGNANGKPALPELPKLPKLPELPSLPKLP